MTGFVRSSDRSRLTQQQHRAVLTLCRWYLANPCHAAGVEIDRIVKAENKLAMADLDRPTNAFVRAYDGARLTIRQHRSLCALVRWCLALSESQRPLAVEIERLAKAAPKLYAILELSSQQARRSAGQKVKTTGGRPDSYWQKRITAARFLKRQNSGRTIYVEKIG